MKPIFWILLIGVILLIAGTVFYFHQRSSSGSTLVTGRLPGAPASSQTLVNRPPKQESGSLGSISLGGNTTPKEQKDTGSGSMGYTLLTPVKPMLVPDQCRNLCISIVGYGAEDFNSPKRGEWETCETQICGWRRPHHFCNHQFEDLSWSLKN